MIADLLQIPFPDPSRYNELVLDGATPRPHWAPFLDSLQAVGEEELARRWERAERRIRENGVTYNVYTDPLGATRPWGIDPIPLLIPPEEWQYIEAGIVQRAQLLNLLLEDIYGERKLLANGDLPPALLFGNPAFLRPLAGVRVPKQSYLHLLAVDLARSPDGQWWVLADRTQAPSGTGYALENRTIVSDVLPDVFRTSNVQRLAPFFRAQREALLGLAKSDHPRVVLLSPGPFNETYFEHSYLARYLGFALVEGADLTVRDRRLYLKTVEGLQAVDVILRRVDDSFCDPLELRGDSFLGVAGLVDAIVAGNVVVANALGSGVIETAAIMPFLPGLSRKLLGERLKLPSVATWWCGQEPALNWVLDHLDEVVVKPAFDRGMEPVFGAGLATAEKQKMAQKLRARPHEYVAQEQVALSTAPVWDHGHLFSRSLVLRAYVLNTGSGWQALPGGLVRVADAEGPVVSMQRGGNSKDAWVLWDQPVDTFSMLRPRHQAVELRRGSTDLPSRAADNLFWLGRYAERSECIARLLRCLMARVRRANEAELNCLFRLYRCLAISKHSLLPKEGPATARDLETELVSLTSDTKRPDSLNSNLAEVQRVGGNVRERLSADFSRLISELVDSTRIEEDLVFSEYSTKLSGCLDLLSGFSGMERENITRGPGWVFLSMGRRLERAIYSVRQLRELIAPLDENTWPVLDYLLEVADSSMTYRSRYFTTLQPVAVLDVLMADSTNPRSLYFQLSHLADLYQKLPRGVPADLSAMHHAMELIRDLDMHTLEYPLPGADSSGRSFEGPAQLDRMFGSLQYLLPSWADNLARTFFDHARSFPISIGG